MNHNRILYTSALVYQYLNKIDLSQPLNIEFDGKYLKINNKKIDSTVTHVDELNFIHEILKELNDEY